MRTQRAANARDAARYLRKDEPLLLLLEGSGGADIG